MATRSSGAKRQLEDGPPCSSGSRKQKKAPSTPAITQFLQKKATHEDDNNPNIVKAKVLNKLIDPGAHRLLSVNGVDVETLGKLLS
jgi:hypothetical protein